MKVDTESSLSEKLTHKIILQFNFCPQPINKNHIIKINVEIVDSLPLKDALI
jgi:hypothetical protein